MNRPEMVALLLELGADPLAWTAEGQPCGGICEITGDGSARDGEDSRDDLGRAASSVRGHRPPRAGPMDLVASLALGDWDTAAHLLRENPGLPD